jgi:hypothetical protein
MTFCTEIKKAIIKYILKHQRHRIATAILSKMFNARGITIPDFKLYYKSLNNKKSMVLAQKQTGRPMGLNRRSRHEPMHL